MVRRLATLTLLLNGKVAGTAHAQTDGSYALSAPEGHYELRVEAPGAVTQTVPVALSFRKPAVLPVKLAPALPTLGRTSRPNVTMGAPLSTTTIGKIAPPRKP